MKTVDNKHDFLSISRDLPGDKRKYYLEKRSKWQYWNIFQKALKSWEITASFITSFIFSSLETSWNTPCPVLLLPEHGAMYHSGTLL